MNKTIKDFDKWNENKKKINHSTKNILPNRKRFFLILSQIRLFSAKRLSRKIYKIDSADFLQIKKELRKVIGLN